MRALVVLRLFKLGRLLKIFRLVRWASGGRDPAGCRCALERETGGVACRGAERGDPLPTLLA